MNFLKKYKSIILFLLVVVLIIVGYLFFFSGSSADKNENAISDKTVNEKYLTEEEKQVGGKVLSLLLRMKSIKLESGIFSNPVFEKLKDNSQKIQDEPVGRDNPFKSVQVDTEQIYPAPFTLSSNIKL